MRTVILTCCVVACSGPSDETDDDTGVPAAPAVVPVDQLVDGKTYSELAGAWYQWAISPPFAESPIADQTGEYCAGGQSGAVWFLGGSYSPDPLERSCTVPEGKYLMLPAMAYLDDWPCPDPAFAPEPGQSLEDFLIADAQGYMDGTVEASLDVDGTVFDALGHHVHSPMFDFTADIAYQAVDGCITGTEQQFLTDGFWMIVEPLPAGTHTLHATANNPGVGFSQDLTWNITVN